MVTFLTAVARCLTKAIGRKRGSSRLSVRTKYKMMAKSWQQEPEAAGPLTSTVREQREMLGGVRTALSL